MTVRIAGGALLVAGELVQPSKVDLFIASYVLQAAGLGVLLMSTIGFLGLAYVSSSIYFSGVLYVPTVAKIPTAKTLVFL